MWFGDDYYMPLILDFDTPFFIIRNGGYPNDLKVTCAFTTFSVYFWHT